MANANLALLTTSNTFMDWLITTNNEANSVNELRNGNYYKDGGNFTIANGTLVITNAAITSIQTSGNNILGQLTTMNTSLTTGAAQFNDNVTATGLNSSLTVANTAQTQFLVVSSANNANAPLLNLATIAATAMSNQNIASVQLTVPSNASVQLVLAANGASVNSNSTGSGNTFRIHAHWNNDVYITSEANSGDIIVRTNIGVEKLRIGANGLVQTSNGNTLFAGNSNITQNLIIGGNASIVAGVLNANNIILDNTDTYSAIQGNLVINNLTVKGNQTIVGTSTLTSASLQLRNSLTTDGDGFLEVWRGTTINANATIKFNHTANVIQYAANDAQTYSTILLVSNIADSVSNNSTTSVGSANAVEWTYNTAVSAANTVATFANGTIVLPNANLNFNNTISINVSAVANGTTQSNVSFSINTTMNLVSLNVSSNLAVGNIIQPTLVATRELLSNVGVVNTPNTISLNAALFSDFDVTLANTQYNSCNLTINSWAQSGNLQTITIILRQPGPNGNTSQTSSNVVTWTNTSIKWSNGEVPVLAGFKGKADILTFTTVDGGTTVYGAHSMANVG